MIVRDREIGLPITFFRMALFSIVGVTLLIAGAMTALVPDLIVKALPIPLFLSIIMLAYLSKTDIPLSDRFLKIWLTILLGTMALWPTYLLIKIGALPTLDGRRIVAGISIGAMFFFLISRKGLLTPLFKENATPFRYGSILIFTYTIWRIISSLIAPSPIEALTTVFWEILYYYSMFFVGALFFSRTSLHEWTMTIFMIIGVLIAGFAGLEWVMNKNILLQLVPNNKEFADFQAALALSRVRDGFFRAQATFEHPLLLAEYSAMLVSFGMAALLWPHKRIAFRILGGVTIMGAVAAALFTGSRSALVTVAAGGGIVFMLWLYAPKQPIQKNKSALRKITFIFTIIATLGIVLPASTLLLQGKSKTEISSTEARLQMLQLGLPSIQQYPLLGTGPGTADSVAGILTGSGITTLDNYFLAIAIESGIPGVLLLLASLLYPIWVVFNRLMSETQDLPQLSAAVAGTLLVTTITHTILWMPFNLFFAFLFSGIVLSYSKANTEKINHQLPSS